MCVCVGAHMYGGAQTEQQKTHTTSFEIKNNDLNSATMVVFACVLITCWSYKTCNIINSPDNQHPVY